MKKNLQFLISGTSGRHTIKLVTDIDWINKSTHFLKKSAIKIKRFWEFVLLLSWIHKAKVIKRGFFSSYCSVLSLAWILFYKLTDIYTKHEVFHVLQLTIMYNIKMSFLLCYARRPRMLERTAREVRKSSMVTNLIAETDSKIVYFCLRQFYC